MGARKFSKQGAAPATAHTGAEHWCDYLPPADPPLGQGTQGRKLHGLFRLAQLVRKRTLITPDEASFTTRLQKGTVEDRFGELETMGLLERAPRDGSPASARLRANAAWSIGVVFERDRVVALPFDLAYHAPELEAVDIEVDVDRDPDAALGAAAEAIRAVLSHDDGSRGECLGAGLAIPAPIDLGGTCRTRIAGGWHGRTPSHEVRASLAASFDRLPIAADNDASVGALGQYLRRFTLDDPAHVPNDLLYVRVADGLGIGWVLKGKFVRGGHGLAGELGHQPSTAADARECTRCGRHCLETVSSTAAVENRLHAQRIYVDLSIGEMVDAFNRLSRTAQGLLLAEVLRAGSYLGEALADACAAVDPSRVILGGPLTRHPKVREVLRTAVEDGLRRTGLPFRSDDLAQRPEITAMQPTSLPLAELRGAAGMIVQRHADAWLWWELEQQLPKLKRAKRPGAGASSGAAGP